MIRNLLSLVIFLAGTTSHSQPLSDLPLFYPNQLNYLGAFRLPASTLGKSSLNYSEGPLEYNADNHSIFIVGHSHHQAIAEFAIPSLVSSENILDLNMATVLQEFSTIFDRAPDGNPQNINRIGGMEYISGDTNSLIVNGYEYYDAPGDNTLTTLIIRNCNNLAGSDIDGFFQFEGGAGHTSGWISPIPPLWQDTLEGTHITGQSSGIPIISRCSVGPSAFSFRMDSLLYNSGSIPTIRLLDFSLAHPLHEGLSNDSLDNDLWTHLSRSTYGFVVPGTRSYLTVGYSGGHLSGVCYKCTQSDGNTCGGYCPPDASDYAQYFWLWDLLDFLKVKGGLMAAHEVRPYAYGELSTPFQNGTQQIGGATFDPVSGVLYLTIQKADREQGTYSNPPAVVAYEISLHPQVDIWLDSSGISLYHNPLSGQYKIAGMLSGYSIEILDHTMEVYQTVITGADTATIELQDLPAGLYFISVEKSGNQFLQLRKILKN